MEASRHDVPLGNYENKYAAQNPISRFLVENFLKNFRELLRITPKPHTIAEIGAGEGFLTSILRDTYPVPTKIFASDISNVILDVARRNLADKNIEFSIQYGENLSYEDHSFDLIVCSEVLEHVQDPNKTLREIYRISNGWVILSVPWEPTWRILNVLRGKYLRHLGNTPGHINHWSRKEFIRLVESHDFKIEKVLKSFPWTMILVYR
ncbi:MAG: class I SAM-dependent methyltransferase [Patescibacteria group bacterium]